MVEITQYALNQRSPTEGKGNVQKLSGKPPHALKGQKLLAQGIALGIMDANLSPCFTLIEQALSVFFNVNYI